MGPDLSAKMLASTRSWADTYSSYMNHWYLCPQRGPQVQNPLPPTSLKDLPRPANRSVLGSYAVAAFVLGPSVNEILCAPF